MKSFTRLTPLKFPRQTDTFFKSFHAQRAAQERCFLMASERRCTWGGRRWLPYCGSLISYLSKHGILSCCLTSSPTCSLTSTLLGSPAVSRVALLIMFSHCLRLSKVCNHLVSREIHRRSQSTTCSERRKQKFHMHVYYTVRQSMVTCGCLT